MKQQMPQLTKGFHAIRIQVQHGGIRFGGLLETLLPEVLTGAFEQPAVLPGLGV